MAPGKRRFWFPLVRLGAFFGAVVVVGNTLLQAAFTPAETDPDPDRRTDFIGRSRKRIEKRIERRLKDFERLFFGSGREMSGAIWLADPELELQEAGPIADARVAGKILPPTLACPEPAPFVAWPMIPEPPSRPVIERSVLEPTLTPENIALFYRYGAADPLADFGDALLRGPEALLDGIVRCVVDLFPRRDSTSLLQESSSGITERIFEFQMGPRQGRIFSEFAANWAEREQRYFSRFADSGFDTVGVEDGTEEVDARALLRDQGKVLWDTARKTYLSKYRFRGEERIREDAFYLNEWRGVDFAVLPPLVAGYVWWRGLEKRVSLGDTWLRFSVEPVSRWVSGKEDMIAGVSLEWGIKGLPVGLIVSAGRYDGRAELDFIGIGTSVGMVRKALGYQLGDSSSRSHARAW
jgi:hypothetical protein